MQSNLSWNLVTIFENKINILQHQFFLTQSEVNLSDLSITTYSKKVTNDSFITEKKIRQVLIKISLKKTSEKFDIINNFFKLMRNFLIKTLICLTQNCQSWKYFSAIFKIAQTVAFWKSEKISYQKVNFWKLIALLKIISKIMKTVMTMQLYFLTEMHNMLSSQQMKAWQNKFTETALTLLLSQIWTIWEEKNNVVMLLLLDMSEVFFKILYK